ncbi:hypothetical protein G9A89_009056 [Geosiphon pyriformis]|nr:hypothetical protein G9A89_009056 [Geosiphon pyriformis]
MPILSKELLNGHQQMLKKHMELEKRTQSPGEVVIEYAKAIRKLIKKVNSGKN